jgi:hypothetical protein
MDDAVLRSLARWPDVPAVYGWLGLDRRGNFVLRVPGTERFERIGNASLREFIARNYECDAHGRWYFQNGPQRVYVRLAYTPLVVHFEGEALFDHCARPFGESEQVFIDEEGSVLLQRATRIALLDDRDLARYADSAHLLQRIKQSEVATRFGFVAEPSPEGPPGRPQSLR